MIGGTIEGTIDFPANQVRMSGTFVPMYGLNNIFGQIPIVGIFLGAGSNEGLIGVTYEIIGTPNKPQLRVNPISAMAARACCARSSNSPPASRTIRSDFQQPNN